MKVKSVAGCQFLVAGCSCLFKVLVLPVDWVSFAAKASRKGAKPAKDKFLPVPIPLVYSGSILLMSRDLLFWLTNKRSAEFFEWEING